MLLGLEYQIHAGLMGNIIIGEVLQDAEPIEAKPKPNRRDEIISETIKEYEGIEDPGAKLERIQAAVLDKLKLNE